MNLDLDRSRYETQTFGNLIQSVTVRVDDPKAAGVDRYVGLEHLNGGELSITRWGSPDDVDAQKLRFQPGDVIFGRRRAYQKKVAYADFEGICSAHAIVLRAIPGKIHPDFLPHFIASDYFLNRAIEISVGSLSPTVNWRDLKVQEFDLPPLDEQRRIADLLWAANSSAAGARALVSSLELFRDQAIGAMVADAEGDIVRFADLASIPSQNGLSKPKASRGGDVPMVNMGELFTHRILEESPSLERVALTELERSRYLLEGGDLLFARRSIVFEGAGLATLVPELTESHTFESSVIRVRPKPELVSPRYLLEYFRSTAGRKSMATIIRRGPVSGIAGSDLRELGIPVPPMQEQKRFEDAALGIERSINAATEAAASARLLTTSLLNAVWEE